MKNAFSMLELVFVIVVIAILASIAIPKLAATRTDAVIAKIRSDVASIRASIATHYQKQILEGNMTCPPLEESTSDGQLFEGILDYPVAQNTGSAKWDGNGTDYNVTFKDGGEKVIKFVYEGPSKNCRFKCTQNCQYLH